MGVHSKAHDRLAVSWSLQLDESRWHSADGGQRVNLESGLSRWTRLLECEGATEKAGGGRHEVVSLLAYSKNRRQIRNVASSKHGSGRDSHLARCHAVTNMLRRYSSSPGRMNS